MEKILVVDDERKIVETIVESLHKEGFLAQGITKSEETLERIASFSPDLLILDVLMPGKNGLDILNEIRKKGDLPLFYLRQNRKRWIRFWGLKSEQTIILLNPSV